MIIFHDVTGVVDISEQVIAGVIDTGDKHSFANIYGLFSENFLKWLYVHVVDVGEHRLQVGDSPVDLPLEAGPGVHEAKGHPQILEGAERRRDHYFLYIGWVHWDLMISFS